MFSFILAAALFLRISGASATLQPKIFPNTTAASVSPPAITGPPTGNCSNQCYYPRIDLSFISWSQNPITATYTVETVVVIVKRRNKSTRTVTFSNADIDFATIAKPTNVNSDGTVIASVVDNDGSTRIVAYPTTVYSDYAPNITWTGTLSTSVSGMQICSTAPTGAVAVFPSHPLLPEGVQVIGVDISEDPKGLTYIPVLVGQERDGDTGNMIENLFPGLSVWDCELPGPPVGLVNSSSGGNESAVGVSGSPVVANGPPIGATGSPVSPDEVSGPKAVPEIPRPGGPGVLQRALLLTTTSTSTELDDEPIPTKASGLRMQPTVAQSDKTAAEMLAHPTETPLCCNMNMAM